MNTKKYTTILLIILAATFTAYKFELFTFEEIVLYLLTVIIINTYDK